MGDAGSYQDSNGSLNGPFHLSHPFRAYGPGERSAYQKRLVEGGDLFTLGHGSPVKTAFVFRQFHMGRTGTERGRDRNDDNIIGQAIPHIQGNHQSGSGFCGQWPTWKAYQVNLASFRVGHGLGFPEW